MAAKFSEEQVHQYLYQTGLESLIDDAPELGPPIVALAPGDLENYPDPDE